MLPFRACLSLRLSMNPLIKSKLKTNAIKSTNGTASVTDSITPVNLTVTDTSTQALEPLTDSTTVTDMPLRPSTITLRTVLPPTAYSLTASMPLFFNSG